MIQFGVTPSTVRRRFAVGLAFALVVGAFGSGAVHAQSRAGDYGSLADISIRGGQTTGTGMVTTDADEDTDNETFKVALGELPTEVTAGTPASVLTIAEPQGGVVTLSLHPAETWEANDTVFVVIRATLDATQLSMLRVHTQFISNDISEINIPAGQLSADAQAIRVITRDNNYYSGDRTFSTRSTLPDNPAGVSVEEASWRWLDDETASTKVTLSASPSDVAETDGTAMLEVTGHLDNDAMPEPLVVTLDLAAGTATAGADYADWDLNLPTVTIAAGATSGSVTVPLEVRQDDLDEGAETLQITGTVPAGTLFSTVEPATVTIVERTTSNQPPTVRVSCEPCMVSRGDVAGLAATASDPDRDPLSYDWYSNGGVLAEAAVPMEATWTAPDGLGDFVVGVVVDDGRGGTDSDDVIVSVINRSPRFRKRTYYFDLPENLDGRQVPIELGHVVATDPEGDGFTYSLAGDGNDRFSVSSLDGAVKYIGPGEDFEVEPNRYALRVLAQDTLLGIGGTRVVVTVVDANDPPEAHDDRAITPEDQAVTVDVLANDGDPDGDSLRVLGVSDAARGRVEIVGAGSLVRYSPDADYHGEDHFTYVVEDGGGLADTAAVAVTVLPVNDAPEAHDDRATTPEDQPVTVDVLVNDGDPDGDSLRVLSVSDAARGRVEIVGAGRLVRYSPDTDYHGEDHFTYVVEDGGGLADTAAVAVTVLPVNDAPEARDDRATTPEDQPVTVDVLANDGDPDGDSLRVLSVSDAARGRVEIVGAGSLVRYSPDADYYGEDHFTYVVEDGGGLADTAAVAVTVLPVNDAPEARDDRATTPEDQPVTVDVLANDGDPDGDGLRVLSVSDAARGRVEIVGAGSLVRYSPDADYHGEDHFTYVVEDGGGLADTAAVAVTVLPVNDAPRPVGSIPHQQLDEGAGHVTLVLTPFFFDLDGDTLIFSAESSDRNVVTAAVSGAVLTLAPIVSGDAVVTVTATDPGALTATQPVTVGVGDDIVRAALSDAFAAMARSHLASARMALRRRVESGGGPRSATLPAGGMRLEVARRSIPLGPENAWQAIRQVAAGWLPQPEDMHRIAKRLESNAKGHSLDVRSIVPDPLGGVRSSITSLRRGFAGDGGGEFILAWRGDGDNSERWDPAWTLWGQHDAQHFAGESSGSATAFGGVEREYEGRLRTQYLGFDANVSDRWLAGVALARSRGSADWTAGSSKGQVTTALTAVHPYLRWSDGTTVLWATYGGGWGEARNKRDLTDLVGSSPLTLGLGVLEVQRPLDPVQENGIVAFGLRADAAWSSVSTADGHETIDGVGATVNQIRIGLDVRSDLESLGAGLASFGEVHLRRDGGDGQTGSGLELSGGLRGRIGILRLVAQGRWLALHSASGYDERGVGWTLSLGQHGDEGLSLSVSPRWGSSAVPTGVLWNSRIPRAGQHLDPASDGWTIDARGEYLLRLQHRLFLTIFTTLGQTLSGRRLELGGQIGVRDGPP